MDDLEDFEARLDELEAEVEQLKSADGRTNAAVGYTMGMTLA
jgi:exonuclease VII small subunit